VAHQVQTRGNECHVALLAERARDGSRAAFEQLVRLFENEVFRMIYYRTLSHADAEDLTQDVFMRAYRNLSKLENTDRFRPWLFSIALNRVWDFLRRRQFLGLFQTSPDAGESAPFEIESEDGPVALNRLLRKEFWQQVKHFSTGLSHWEQEVFVLRFMEYLSIKEIAELLNKSESAVKTHLYRAIKKLQNEPALLRLLREDIA
jgi:RNA polymerase sigma-70 factor (ECF subfamily)